MIANPLELYSAYLDGRGLRDDEVACLRAWIAADEENAREFVEMAIVHAAISDRLVLGKLFDDLATHRLGVITPESLAEAIREIESASPRIERLAADVASTPRSVSGLAAPMAAVAAAFLFIGCWALWGDNGPTIPPAASQDQAPSRIASAPPTAKLRPVVAKVGSTFGAKWMFDEYRIPGDKLRVGARVDLLAGVAELEMDSGVVVVLEGPCHVELQDAYSLSLADGKAAVRNDGAAETFVVNTPTMQVIDRGTEFGVGTAPLGETLVSVFDGSVAIADAAAEAHAAGNRAERRLEAGYEVNVLPSDDPTSAGWRPQPVKNDRVFVRPDEVKVRLRAQAGSLADQKLADHFRRKRIKGLLAYQGFDAPSSGLEYVQGLNGQGIVAIGNLAFSGSARGAAGGLEIQNGPAFMGFDATVDGPFGRAGLLSSSGLIGKPGTEVWLTWRTQRIGAVVGSNQSAGLSLMFGERPDLDEPLFLGQAANGHVPYCVETAWGDAPPPNGRRVTVDVDFDRNAPGVQLLAVDDEPHAWVMRLQFRDGADHASVWIDPDLARLDPEAPDAALDVANIAFDRLRLASHRDAEVWRFSEVAAGLSWESLRELAQVDRFLVDK